MPLLKIRQLIRIKFWFVASLASKSKFINNLQQRLTFLSCVLEIQRMRDSDFKENSCAMFLRMVLCVFVAVFDSLPSPVFQLKSWPVTTRVQID